MSRRTKWFDRFGRKAPKSRRTPAPRADRALVFEQCEPRIALSTNDAGGFAYAYNAVSEGGLIGFDSSPVLQFNSDMVTSQGPGQAGSLVLVRGDWLTHVQAQAVDRDAGDTLNYGGAFSDESKVRLIDSPLAGLNHPEGGQIVITERPSAGWAALSASPTGFAGLRTSRPPVVSQELNTSVEASATRDADSLRGRAMMLEVAHATPSTSHRTGSDSPAESWRLAAVNELYGSRISAEFSRAEQFPESSQADAQVRTSSQQPAYRGVDASEHDAMPAVASPASAFQSVGASVLSAIKVEMTSDEIERPIALATRDTAFDQWRPGDAALLSDRESTATPLLVRSRRVLAVALVLTAGAGSFGKIFRRRKPDNAWETHPRSSRAVDAV